MAKRSLALDALLDTPALANATWGVRVEAADGTVLFDRNGDKRLMPASVMKLFTTAAAIELLGADWRYRTELVAYGKKGGAGRWDGDVVIVGSGDPSLGSTRLNEARGSAWLMRRWTEAVRKATIRRIAGSIVGDGSFLGAEKACRGWELGDMAGEEALRPTGLAIEENGVHCQVTPAARPGLKPRLLFVPQSAFYSIENHARTVAADDPCTLHFEPQAGATNAFHLVGGVPAGSKPVVVVAPLHDGNLWGATLLAESLGRAKIVVTQGARATTDKGTGLGAERRALDAIESAPLGELLALCNKPSNNFFADQFLRTLGAQHDDDGSFDGGARVVRRWLESINLPDVAGYSMSDGSGLARRSLVQARQVTALLRHMASRPSAATFFNSLPLAGTDRDLVVHFPELNRLGRIVAKTGLIDGVRALAGVATTPDGEQRTFALLLNNHTQPWREVDRQLARIVRQIVE